MRVVLKPYQTDATRKILKSLDRARRDWHEYRDQTAFALSAPTSSGKTVIAAAAIEATLHGSDEFGIEADPTAVFLWVSKDPALNEQTMARFRQHADQIPLSNLIMLDKSYSAESLATGKVYFINPQKLAVSGGFVKRTDIRNVTFWDILANTIGNPNKTLYMVLDEAHEGMRPQSSSDQTIVMRIINGNDGPGVPVVWGVSATIDRFNKAMENTPSRTKRPNIIIDPKDVQDSGLIKTTIHLDIPDEAGYFDTALVRDATEDFLDVCERWDEYTQSQGINEPVVPLLVVQIPNKGIGESDTDKGVQEQNDLIHLVLETIRKTWPELPENGIAHVLGVEGAIAVGRYVIPKVAPEKVQRQSHIRVLIAKDAISTGWDCPRAEVLVSLRPGKDPTYVTQLIGRMVRNPLAESTGVDRLNAASAYLPKFDLKTTKSVIDELLGEGDGGGKGWSTSLVRKVLLKPVTLGRNQQISADVADAIESLPSYGRVSTAAKPIKRLLRAAQAFAQDELVLDANRQAHTTMFAVLDGIKANFANELTDQADKILTADIRRLNVDLAEGTTGHVTESRAADAGTVDDALRHLQRVLSKSVVNGYVGRNVEHAINEVEAAGGSLVDVNVLAIKAEVAALGLLKLPNSEQTVRERVEEAADLLTRQWLLLHSAAIARLSDSRKGVYDEIRGMAKEPELAAIEVPTEELVDTVDAEGKKLPLVANHVLSTPSGRYPLDAKLNRWERAVISHELADINLRGWYRNPSAATTAALSVPYKSIEAWKSVQPDLIFVREGDDGLLRSSIVDPHGAHLGDASLKLKALAWYADEHGSKFERILSIGAESPGHELLALNLLDSSVRKAVYECPSDNVNIRELFTELGEVYTTIED